MSKVLQRTYRPVPTLGLMKSWRIGRFRLGPALGGRSTAASLLWVGLGGNDNWSTGSNWGGLVPINGDALIFDGSTRLTPVNNLVGLRPASISFNAGAGAFSLSGTQVLFTAGSVSTATGPTRLISNTLDITGALTATTVSNLELRGLISGTGSIVKAGAGTLKLGVDSASPVNTYSGGTVINAGTLRMAIDGNSVLGSGSVTIAGTTANLHLDKNTLTNPLIVNAAGTLTLDNGFGNTINTTIALNATLTANHLFNTTYSGVLSGSGGFTKTGSAAATFTQANTYTGTTTVSAGTLIYQNTYASSSHVIAPGAVLEFNVASGTRDGATTTFSGGGAIRKTGAGTLQWPSPMATFALASGSIIDVQGGIVIGASFANEVWTSNLSALAISSGATFDGIEGNIRVAGLSGAGSLLTGYAGAGYTEFTLGVDNGAGTFSGVIGNSVSPGSLTKTGTGTQTLSGANTYTGVTTVSGGVLSITGSLSASTTTTVSGGTLQGGGTVGPVVVANVASSVLQGGVGAATTLNTGTVTFNGTTAKLRVNTDGASAISVVAAAAVTLGGVTVDFNSAQNLTAGTYNVITGTSMSGTATQGTLPIGRTWTSLTVVGNNLVAVLA